MLIATAAMWLTQTNCWLLAKDSGGPAVIIDAPPDAEAIGDLLARHDLYPVALLLTHGHVDHMGGSCWVGDKYQIVTYVDPADDYLTLDPVAQVAGLFGMVPPGDYAPPERREVLNDGVQLELAGVKINALHTPGHTPGHFCFYVEEEGILLSGDQLFAGSIGRTDLPGGDYGQLMNSMASKVMPLPPETQVLPGHGPTTTLAAERRYNPFLADLA